MVQVLIYSPDGRCLSKYQAYESGLGVKTVSWSPCGQFLAVGSYDQMLRVLNHLTWKTFAEFLHLSTVRAPCYAAVFKVILFFFKIFCFYVNCHYTWWYLFIEVTYQKKIKNKIIHWFQFLPFVFIMLGGRWASATWYVRTMFKWWFYTRQFW